MNLVGFSRPIGLSLVVAVVAACLNGSGRDGRRIDEGDLKWIAW